MREKKIRDKNNVELENVVFVVEAATIIIDKKYWTTPITVITIYTNWRQYCKNV